MSAVSVDHRNRHNGRSERRESAGSLLCPPHSETAAVLLMLCWTRRRLGVGSSKPWTHRLRDAPLADLVAGGYLVTNLCARAREMALTGTPCRRCFRNHRHDPVDRRVDSPPASRDARCSLRDRPLRGIGLGRARDRDRLRYCADTLPRGGQAVVWHRSCQRRLGGSAGRAALVRASAAIMCWSTPAGGSWRKRDGITETSVRRFRSLAPWKIGGSWARAAVEALLTSSRAASYALLDRGRCEHRHRAQLGEDVDLVKADPRFDRELVFVAGDQDSLDGKLLPGRRQRARGTHHRPVMRSL